MRVSCFFASVIRRQYSLRFVKLSESKNSQGTAAGTGLDLRGEGVFLAEYDSIAHLPFALSSASKRGKTRRAFPSNILVFADCGIERASMYRLVSSK